MSNTIENAIKIAKMSPTQRLFVCLLIAVSVLFGANIWQNRVIIADLKDERRLLRADNKAKEIELATCANLRLKDREDFYRIREEERQKKEEDYQRTIDRLQGVEKVIKQIDKQVQK